MIISEDEGKYLGGTKSISLNIEFGRPNLCRLDLVIKAWKTQSQKSPN
jgi:hypothetical protein